jgi:short-subunit dehydrogenase
MNATAQKKVMVSGATDTIGKAVLAALLPKYQFALSTSNVPHES